MVVPQRRVNGRDRAIPFPSVYSQGTASPFSGFVFRHNGALPGSAPASTRIQLQEPNDLREGIATHNNGRVSRARRARDGPGDSRRQRMLQVGSPACFSSTWTLLPSELSKVVGATPQALQAFSLSPGLEDAIPKRRGHRMASRLVSST